MHRLTASRAGRAVTIGLIVASWLSVAMVAWSRWPGETACLFDHDAIAREAAALPVLDLPTPQPPAAEPRRLADCVVRGSIADERLRAAFPSLWAQAFWTWSHAIRAHGAPIVSLALDAPDGDVYVVLADRCAQRMAIAEWLADIWVRGRGHYPAVRFRPVEPNFDRSVLQLEPGLASLWSDGAQAQR